ncbi:MAG TPA: MFS transporter [Roseiflexaceae bacterium]|nr:MFS transporter [Roseiflexaceae bacterium]
MAERWILSAAILASSMAFIDSTALNVALPSLQSDLQASGAQLLWIVNGYLLMLAALILVGGSLGDKLGRKKIFMVGIGLFLLASLACGLAPTIAFLIEARVVQGIGGALMIPGSLAIISASFADERRGRAIGTWSAVTTLVTIAGPVLGGFLAEAGLWRGVFLINVPLGIAALLALFFKVPESRDEESSPAIDYLGAALASLGLAGLTYGFISAPRLGFGDLSVAGTLLGGVIALLGFVIVEARGDHPMLPLQLFRSRTFSGANLLTLFLYGALSVGIFILSLNLVQAQGYSQSIAGFAFTPFAVLIAGPTLAGLGFLLLSFVGLADGPASYWTTFFPGILIFGVGMAITVVPLTAAVMGAAPAHYSGTASGINNAVSRIAGVLAIAIVGALALFVFADALDTRTAMLGLSDAVRSALRADAARLGAAGVPRGVTPEQSDAIGLAIRLAFVDTFHVVMLVCAALAWLSAAMAALLVRRESPGS